MGKISASGGPSHAVGNAVITRIKAQRLNGASLESLSLELNQGAVLLPDADGTPRAGLWSVEAVQRLLDGEIL